LDKFLSIAYFRHSFLVISQIDVECKPKKTTTVKEKSVDKGQKKPTYKMTHLVLPYTQADNSENQKSHFWQRTDRKIYLRTVIN
jgi:hypothetical protein